MKKLLLQIGTYLILILIIIFLYKSSVNNRKNWEISENNYKSEMLSKEGQNRSLLLTMNQIENSNDSILIKLDSVRKELKIKDKYISQLQYIKEEISKIDTIIMKDTIFKDKNLKIDTTLNYKYYILNLKLEYPNKIITEPRFILEKYIIFSSRKETIKPKKIWPLYWFQRKHIICDIKVIEENPYVDKKEYKFIEIIK